MKIKQPDSYKSEYFPADKEGVWVSSNGLSRIEIALVRCVPECWIVDENYLGYARVNEKYANEKKMMIFPANFIENLIIPV